MRKSLKARSWLIVEPSADAAEVRSAGADRIVLDLTGVPGSWKMAAEFSEVWCDLYPDDRPDLLVPPFSSGDTEKGAELAVELNAKTILLTGVRSGADIQRLDVILRVAEARTGVVAGSTGIIALASSAGILAANSFERCSRRLRAIAWENQGNPLSDTSRLVRATIGLAASAAGVTALDAASPTGDETAFRSECLTASENGFAGKLSRQYHQIPIINRIFADQVSPPVGRTISKTSEPPSA